MRHPAVEKILILQDRDTKRISLEAQIKQLPGDIEAVEKKILAEKAAIEDARSELKSLETKKKLLETEIGGAQETLRKYRTQQSLVKKNDEYQALGHQIETTESAIGTLEEKELEVMFAIDGAKGRFAAAEKVLKDNIAGHQSRIASLQELGKNLSSELVNVQGEVASARAPLDELSLRLYDRIGMRTQPVIAAVRGGKCSGCHLKISGESESAARKSDALATCDQCGRIIWLD